MERVSSSSSPATRSHRSALSTVVLIITLLAALLVSVATAPAASAATTPATDNFNRPNGALGPNWTAMTDGALAIASQTVAGTKAAYSGAIRTAETYTADQSSHLQITAPQLTGNQMIGVGVRAQNGGRQLYFGAYVWNNGSPVLRLFKRGNGIWTQLGSYASGVLAAGTTLRLSVNGSILIVWQNSSARIIAMDSSITSGAPAVMAFGTPRADNWNGGGNTTNTPTFSVGGTVSGLSGTVVLQNNAADDLTRTANGAFTFATRLQYGAPYAVTVKTNPVGQTCTVTNGTGTIGTTNVSNITVTCTTLTFSVGGTVSGLAGTVVLQNNGADDLTRTANGAFTFATRRPYNTSYAVTVKTNPTGQTCTVTNGSGTIGLTNVTNVSVTCTTLTFSVGGTVSGLTGTVVLQNNAADDLTVTANGPFTFATRRPYNTSYAVTVKTNPTGQTCTVTNGSGTVGTANVTNVTVTCTTDVANDPTDDFNRADGGLGSNWSPTIDGGMAIAGQAVVGTQANNYSGNRRTGETYANDQSSQLQLTNTQLSGGQWIGVGVRAQNSGSDLYLGLYWWNNGNPLLMLFERSGGNWTPIAASYSPGPLPAGTQLKLSAVGSTLTFSQDGIARITATDTTLTGGVPAVMAYDTPTADNWQGTGATGIAPTYSVGGTASGLTGSVVLQDNGADDVTVPADGTFSFATRLHSGAGYAVTVKTHPSGQTCAVTNATGTIGAANVVNVAVTCTTFTVGNGTVTDDFNRADGALGSNWSATIDGAMAITGQAVVGTRADNHSGNIRTHEIYAGDQSSQLQLTNQLSGGQWIGVGVHAQNNGLDLYLGLYWWNNGSPVLMLFERTNGTWTQIAATYPSGSLPVGTQLQLSAVGSTLTFSQDGIARITATDTTLTGGAPAIMAFDTPKADNWQGAGATGIAPTYSVGGTVSGMTGSVVLQNNGGDNLAVSANGTFTFGNTLVPGTNYAVTIKTNPAGQSCSVANGTGTIAASNVTNVAVTCSGGFSVQLLNTDANGVEHYRVTSANNGPGTTTLRVLRPTHPAAGVAHNFVYALPVEPGEGTTFGDPITTLAALDAQDQYNLTIVVPSFAIAPWYADDVIDGYQHYETYMANELQPWVKAHLSTTGVEQHWLLGFSKSGIGGQDLILKRPDVFTLVASWDFPGDMSTANEYGGGDNYGTEANFQANYRLTPAFLDAHKAPFTTNNRMWIGGNQLFFQEDVADYDVLLTSEGIQHTLAPVQAVPHSWDGGWVAGALAALEQDSINFH